MKQWLFGPCLIPTAAFQAAVADETLKLRTIIHATNMQTQDVGDVDGHLLILAKFTGLGSMPDGSVSKVYVTTLSDAVKGSGAMLTLYYNVTTDDGSVLWLKGHATITPKGDKTLFNGPVTVVGGTGRYQGAKGDGTWDAVRVTPLVLGAEAYNDLVINLKK
jgi:hypothetical protein